PLWDKDAKTTVAKTDPATGRVSGHEAYAGEVDWRVRTVWETFPEPVTDWDDVTWCEIAEVWTLERIREEFPKYGPLVSAEEDDGGTAFGGIALAGAHEPQGVRTRLPSARVLNYYQKPGRKHPKGRWLIVADGILLYREESLPHPKGEFPIIPVQGLPAIEGLWGKSLI